MKRKIKNVLVLLFVLFSNSFIQLVRADKNIDPDNDEPIIIMSGGIRPRLLVINPNVVLVQDMLKINQKEKYYLNMNTFGSDNDTLWKDKSLNDVNLVRKLNSFKTHSSASH